MDKNIIKSKRIISLFLRIVYIMETRMIAPQRNKRIAIEKYEDKKKKRKVSLHDNIISIHANTMKEALTLLKLRPEDTQVPTKRVKSPYAVVSWVQRIGRRMHQMLEKRDSHFNRCVWNVTSKSNDDESSLSLENIVSTGDDISMDEEDTSKPYSDTPLILTIPDPRSFYNNDAIGCYIPKKLMDQYNKEKYLVRYACLMGLKLQYRKESGADIEITHICTAPVSKIIQALCTFDEGDVNNDIDECAFAPWLLNNRGLTTSSFGWNYIPWYFFPKLLTNLRLEDETIAPDDSHINSLSESTSERHKPQMVTITKKSVSGTEITITRKSNEGNGVKELKPLILANGWNKTITSPRSSSDLCWILKDIKKLSRSGRTPIFALDKDEANRKVFLTTTYRNLWKIINQKVVISGILPRSQRCAHSVILNDYACKAFWDMELGEPPGGWPKPMDILKKELLISMISLSKVCFAQVFNITLEDRDFLILEACKPTKISFHVILASPGLFFATYEHMKKFFRILECFIVQKLVSVRDDTTDSSDPLREYAMKILFLPKDDMKRQSKRPLDLIEVEHRKSDKGKVESIRLACFWDMGASDKRLAYFRTPMSTKFAEDRPLHISEHNQFEPDERIFRQISKVSSLTHEEMIFLSGLPTAVYKRFEDDKSISASGLIVSDGIMESYVREVLVDNSRRFPLIITGLNGGEPVIAEIEVAGLANLLSSPYHFGSSGSYHPSNYTRTQRRGVGSWNFQCSQDVKGLTKVISNLFETIPDFKHWTNVLSFDYSLVYGTDRKNSRSRGKPELSGILIKVSHSTWCPIKRGHHSEGRKGIAKVMIWRNKGGKGAIKASCFNSHCGERSFDTSKLRRQLSNLFRVFDSNT